MRNILILTDYHEDTLHAMELTWRNVSKEPAKLVLLSLSPLPDSMQQILSLSKNEDTSQRSQERLLHEWELRESLLGISIDVIHHHQYGASAPIIEQIIERYQINSIAIPFSIQKSENDIHKEALMSLDNIKSKIVWMPERKVSFIME